ncbi:MAG TPA: type II toxin-antitoxin system VapC family toxin [Caulobacteraceae bacterium]
MTPALLLDTHIVLWLDSGDDRLRTETRSLIDGCWRAGGTIYLSAVTAWEIALLGDAGRIELDVSAARWIERFLDRPGVVAAPLSWRAACGAYDVTLLEHRDPADRLLIGTAIELACPMVTYDRRIANFAANHGQRYGFSTATA